MNRRNFLYNAALASGGAILTFGGFTRRAEAVIEARSLASFRAAGFGELLPAVTQNTGETSRAAERLRVIKLSEKSAARDKFRRHFGFQIFAPLLGKDQINNRK